MMHRDILVPRSLNAARRAFLQVAGLGLVATATGPAIASPQKTAPREVGDFPKWDDAMWHSLTEKQWRERLSAAAYRVLRRDGTERPFTSSLNAEKRAGWYACSGCGLVLFSSVHKYESGTGWPSFDRSIKGRCGTSKDFKLLLPRTEYHCIRCRGHQGHVFNDGPRSTGKRWCNNGVALVFAASSDDLQ